MTVWIDISNAPHVNFFKGLIADWSRQGHEIVVTSRPLSNTIPLLEKHGIDHVVIGKHYGKGLLAKLIGFPVRCVQLWLFLRSRAIDVAVSQSSFYSPVVARASGFFSVYTNDNEHAKGNLIAFIFSNRILLPQALESWAAEKWCRRKIQIYPGVKESIYLEEDARNLRLSRQHEGAECKYVFFRPEPWTAQYHNAEKSESVRLLKELTKNFYVKILPRGDDQRQFFEDLEDGRLSVVKDSLTVHEIARECCVFVGAGGSMSREFAVLGVPTISTYRGNLLQVDLDLISRGLMKHTQCLTAQDVVEYAETYSRSEISNEEILKQGRQAYRIFEDSITVSNC